MPFFRASFWKFWRRKPGSWGCVIARRKWNSSEHLTGWDLKEFGCQENFPVIWETLLDIWNRNYSRVPVTNLSKARMFKKRKKKHQKRLQQILKKSKLLSEAHGVFVKHLVNKFLSRVDVYIDNLQSYNSIGSMQTSFTILTTSRDPSLSRPEFCTGQCMTLNNQLLRIWTNEIRAKFFLSSSVRYWT